MGVVVRRASPEDDAALAAIDAVAWPIGTYVVAPGGPPFFTDRSTPEQHLVAEDGGVVAGYVKVAPATPLDSNVHVLHVSGLAVDPAHRGRGIGRALVAAAIDEARRQGARKLGLRVLATNETAQALYRSCGFVEEGRLRDEFRLDDGRYVDDVFMAVFV